MEQALNFGLALPTEQPVRGQAGQVLSNCVMEISESVVISSPAITASWSTPAAAVTGQRSWGSVAYQIRRAPCAAGLPVILDSPQ